VGDTKVARAGTSLPKMREVSLSEKKADVLLGYMPSVSGDYSADGPIHSGARVIGALIASAGYDYVT
jgi:hypothetical protein